MRCEVRGVRRDVCRSGVPLNLDQNLNIVRNMSVFVSLQVTARAKDDA